MSPAIRLTISLASLAAPDRTIKSPPRKSTVGGEEDRRKATTCLASSPWSAPKLLSTPWVVPFTTRVLSFNRTASAAARGCATVALCCRRAPTKLSGWSKP